MSTFQIESFGPSSPFVPNQVFTLGINGETTGNALVWDGNSWVPGSGGGSGGLDSVIFPMTGTGEVGTPLKIADGTTSGNVLSWSGAAWGDAAPIQGATLPMTGAGTVGDPLRITDGTTSGDILTWNGASWAGATLEPIQGATLPMTGAGTVGDPLRIIDGTTTGNVLSWSGAAWGDAAPIQGATLPMTGAGTGADPLRITDGTTSGDVLTWNGAAWAGATPAGGGGAPGAFNAYILAAASGDPEYTDIQSALTASKYNICIREDYTWNNTTGISTAGDIVVYIMADVTLTIDIDVNTTNGSLIITGPGTLVAATSTRTIGSATTDTIITPQNIGSGQTIQVQSQKTRIANAFISTDITFINGSSTDYLAVENCQIDGSTTITADDMVVSLIGNYTQGTGFFTLAAEDSRVQAESCNRLQVTYVRTNQTNVLNCDLTGCYLIESSFTATTDGQLDVTVNGCSCASRTNSVDSLTFTINNGCQVGQVTISGCNLGIRENGASSVESIFMDFTTSSSWDAVDSNITISGNSFRDSIRIDGDPSSTVHSISITGNSGTWDGFGSITVALQTFLEDIIISDNRCNTITADSANATLLRAVISGNCTRGTIEVPCSMTQCIITGNTVAGTSTSNICASTRTASRCVIAGNAFSSLTTNRCTFEGTWNDSMFSGNSGAVTFANAPSSCTITGHRGNITNPSSVDGGNVVTGCVGTISGFDTAAEVTPGFNR